MKTISVLHYDAFTEHPNQGNPAGIVLEGEKFNESEMQKIAEKVGFNETSFVLPSNIADLRIRYFTPGHEMNLCGHATIATVFALKANGHLPEKETILIETRAGILPIRINQKEQSTPSIIMKQIPAQFKEFNGSRKELAEAIGIAESDLDVNQPILYGSTGIWTLLVPIKSLHVFSQMVPKNDLFPSILKEIPNASVHPFCLETFEGEATMHGRHFSSPFSGTIEDPVTGTASGVMGAYYVTYINDKGKNQPIVIEQGKEIGRNGKVSVTVSDKDDQLDVEISGTAVFVKEIKIILE
ncbi:PhzF family phenazine biosynthesis isomerase [Cytobacillus oceanisediminis]|uniref:PhzF family phenazine biosynthesis isomerase n=1 Tax=Niallia alba TaxID=2729105 RepID=A0A7Y0K9G0_9BACI|nr:MULTISPECIES: PhzF family phenazine biosynthesis isomerase [Bacillaceae]EOR20895.1 phenazine biosynthesis protein, PhzF family [Niallia nealsonii AAU1]MBQ6447559.1 PhzF family phenazine biosynthesis isomerase [Bacillus sp. (in: firmicutes)]MBZ9536250.1 PhzF family phenazine biosynthesis isomerase [Cytobacillus oceanisediminis]NMO78067.1 PhzF family phenazine biosynthesis isomerase [Niallia alba]